jgi:hypothetical protein
MIADGRFADTPVSNLPSAVFFRRRIVANPQSPPRVAVNADAPRQPHEPPWVGEVQARVLPEMFEGRPIVRLGRLDLVFEETQVDGPAAMNGRPPLAPAGVPRDPFETRGGAVAVSLVACVLSPRAHPEIVTTVVMLVAVDVVHHHPGRRVHDEPVHEDIFSPDHAAGVTRAPAHGMPGVLVEPFEIGRIDDRRFAFAQIDVANALIRRDWRRLPLPAEPSAVRHLGAARHQR